MDGQCLYNQYYSKLVLCIARQTFQYVLHNRVTALEDCFQACRQNVCVQIVGVIETPLFWYTYFFPGCLDCV